MREIVRIWAAPALLVIVVAVLALLFAEPPPPRSVTIASGAEGGSYALAADRYAQALSESGVSAHAERSAGSVDNLRRVKSGEADIALVQTGLASDFGTQGVRSLGAVFLEPLWVFYSGRQTVREFDDLRGLKVAIGPEGSGVRVLARVLFDDVGLEEGAFEGVPLAGQAAASALMAGEIEAAVVIAAPDAPWIRELASDPSVRLLSLERAPAYARRHPYLASVTLFRGVLDLERDLPSRDIVLLSPVAQIVVRENLHPAIQVLLIEAAYSAHSSGSMLSEPGFFPTPKLADIPLSREADRYYRDGPSFLRRIFPFDVANFLERAWVFIIPLATLIFPLVRASPPIYRWRIRRKIYLWYRHLRDLEAAGRAAGTMEERDEVIGRLHALQVDASRIQVPLSFTDDLYRLRAHIRFVADLVDRAAVRSRDVIMDRSDGTID